MPTFQLIQGRYPPVQAAPALATAAEAGISAAGALVVRLMRKLRISWQSAIQAVRSVMLSARLRRLRSSLFRCSSWFLSVLWFSRPSLCSTLWFTRPRRFLQNSWWTVCYLQASIAVFEALKHATGWRPLSAIRRCHSLLLRQSFPLPVGRCLSMRRRLIQLAMLFSILDRVVSVRTTKLQFTSL